MSTAPALDVSVPDAEIEAGAGRLWRTDAHRTLGPWLARSRRTPGGTTASVAVLGTVDEADIPALVAAAEGFYAECGRPARFELAATTRVEPVQRALLAAGYRYEEQPTFVRLASLRSLRGIAPQHREGRVRVSDAPTEAWFGEWWRNVGSQVPGADAESSMDVLWDLPGRCAFASHVVDDTVVATGLGVVDGSWLGIYCLSSSPQRRGAGSVRRIVGALGTWGNALAARTAYLRVAADDEALLRFSEQAGFVTSYQVDTLVAR